LQNLIGNAIKYNPLKHPVEVFVKRTSSEEQVEVTVRDKGMGIEPGELSRIFDPFFRGSNAINHQIRGTGLGLSLVKAILEAHGGQIKVESTVGQGSTFTLVLPVFPSDAGISNE
jgi:signal transduction histidine kinase